MARTPFLRLPRPILSASRCSIRRPSPIRCHNLTAQAHCPLLPLPGATRKAYSTTLSSEEAQLKPIPNIDPSALTITNSTTPKKILPPQDLIFGRTFTDHMLSIEWTSSSGWLPPRITPYQNLSLDPATCVFHYAFECFEGMKAYKNSQGEISLFRPDRNMRRLNRSAARIALPTFDSGKLIDLIKTFVKLDERFIPSERGYSLYLRPTLIGTQRTLGVGPPGSALLYIIASPVGPYYPTGFKAVSLEATTYAVRAWPGGVGDRKLGANYAPGIVPQLEAARRGCQQNLWLFGEENYVTEVGTMNFFAAMRTREGKKVLLTAPLDGTILEGVTRESVLQLARERLVPMGWEVEERRFTMQELADASEEGRLMECFGAGTAAVVSPVREIHWGGGAEATPGDAAGVGSGEGKGEKRAGGVGDEGRGETRIIGCGLKPNEEAGEVATLMKGWIEGIQYGDEKHAWSWPVER